MQSLSPGEEVMLENPNNCEIHEQSCQIRVPHLLQVILIRMSSLICGAWAYLGNLIPVLVFLQELQSF